MKNILKIVFCLSFPILLFFSCKKKDIGCDTNVPCGSRTDSSWVKVKITLNSENDSVPLYLYKDNVNTGELLQEIISFSKEETFFLPVNNSYSAKAEYKKGGKKIVAYDGGTLKMKEFINCDSSCFELKNLTLDLELN
jgi:hypothetical protein